MGRLEEHRNRRHRAGHTAARIAGHNEVVGGVSRGGGRDGQGGRGRAGELRTIGQQCIIRQVAGIPLIGHRFRTAGLTGRHGRRIADKRGRRGRLARRNGRQHIFHCQHIHLVGGITAGVADHDVIIGAIRQHQIGDRQRGRSGAGILDAVIRERNRSSIRTHIPLVGEGLGAGNRNHRGKGDIATNITDHRGGRTADHRRHRRGGNGQNRRRAGHRTVKVRRHQLVHIAVGGGGEIGECQREIRGTAENIGILQPLIAQVIDGLNRGAEGRHSAVGCGVRQRLRQEERTQVGSEINAAKHFIRRVGPGQRYGHQVDAGSVGIHNADQTVLVGVALRILRTAGSAGFHGRRINNRIRGAREIHANAEAALGGRLLTEGANVGGAEQVGLLPGRTIVGELDNAVGLIRTVGDRALGVHVKVRNLRVGAAPAQEQVREGGMLHRVRHVRIERQRHHGAVVCRIHKVVNPAAGHDDIERTTDDAGFIGALQIVLHFVGTGVGRVVVKRAVQL